MRTIGEARVHKSTTIRNLRPEGRPTCIFGTGLAQQSVRGAADLIERYLSGSHHHPLVWQVLRRGVGGFCAEWSVCAHFFFDYFWQILADILWILAVCLQ